MTSEYGTYRLTYTPPASDGYTEYRDITIDMSTGGDANVSQMLRFYEAFLSAAGYILNGELQVVEDKPEQTYSTSAASYDSYGSYYFDDAFSMTGNPYWAPDTISIGGAGMVGGLYNDVVTLG